jgi:hypothetical protein
MPLPVGHPCAMTRLPLLHPSGVAWLTRTTGALLLLACVPFDHSEALAQGSGFLPAGVDIDVKGYIEARAVATGRTRSWEDSGLGKLRFGSSASGGRRALAKLEGAAVGRVMFGFDWTGFVHVAANEEQHVPVDVIEAYLQYKPAPKGPLRFSAKAGVFIPPISLENTGLAWTSPYTITSSAINSWVGEELKAIGGEATATYRVEDVNFQVSGAAFIANDPAGTLLAWRGWALHDREVGLFDRLALAPVRITRPGARLFRQAPTEEPFHEIDNRVGYYAHFLADHLDYGQVTALWYDNNANDRAFKFGQWAWRTKFWALSYKVTLPSDIDVLAQVMKGGTTVVTPPGAPSAVVDTNFWAAYLLASKEFGRHRFSLRLDRFGTNDEDLSLDDNNEHGTAVTAAYVLRPAPRQRLTLEALYVKSHRPERVHLGLPIRAGEAQIQASYRFFF